MNNCIIRHSKNDRLICTRCGKDYGHYKDNHNINELYNSECLFFSENPSALKILTNFTNSLGKYILSGMKIVKDDTAAHRMKICRDCEYFQNDQIPTCSKCGCILSIKTLWASEECPIKKWQSTTQKIKKCGSCGKKNKIKE